MKETSTLARGHRRALAALGLVALAPAALTYCAPRAGTDRADASATAADPPPSDRAIPPSVFASAPAPVTATDAAVAVPAASSGRPTCGALEQAIDRDLQTRACGSNDDCTVGNRYCGCSQPITRSAKKRLAADQAAWTARGCATEGPPRPCATCGPPPNVGCIDGRCSVTP